MATKTFILSLLVAGTTASWLNDFDQPVNFQCPDGQFLAHVGSRHDNDHEDRIWDMSCRKIPIAEVGTTNCIWTNYVNELDQPVIFQCPLDNVMTGMASVHDNGKEDRQFRFRCCEVPGALTHSCYFTNYENDFDGILEYTVPANKIMKGMDSYHDNGKE